VRSPCNPLIEDYTEILYEYITDEGGAPFFQCKMNLRGPKSMRKVDGMSLTFIDFYVPALTPCLHSTESSLQVSENINFFAVGRIYTGVIKRDLVYTICLGYHIYTHTHSVQCGDRT
jgi:hypothetical protein